MQKKKNLIIVLISIMSILLLGIVLAVVYLKTDFLKTDKQLFYKYLLEENQMLDMVKKEKQNKNSKSYTGSGNIDFIYEYNNDVEVNENDQIAKNLQKNLQNLESLKKLTGTIESNVDKTNNKEYHAVQLEKNEEKIMEFELARDEEKYAIKSKQVANSYIGIENDNLKEFLKKMGIENEEIIPDKIDFEKIYKAITEINPDEKEHIYETYKEVLLQSIDSSNYSKQKNQKININNNAYNTDLYTLTLTKAEAIDNLVKILQTLKQDSITLNMICNKIKVINPNSSINIRKLNEKIDLYIDEVNKIEKSDNEFIRIDVYVDKKIVRKIDFLLENKKQISFEYEEKDGKKILQVTRNNFLEEPTAIVYDIRESLLNTKKIRIIKEADFTTYQFVMYNIKDIYKTILDEQRKQNETAEDEEKIEATNENNIENKEDDRNENINESEYENDVNKYNQDNIDEIQKIYDEYNNIDEELAEISLNIKLQNNRENNTLDSLYLLIFNSKAGMDISNEKNYTDDIEKNITLDQSNSIMLNNYSKETIDKLIEAVRNKGKEILKRKIGL